MYGVELIIVVIGTVFSAIAGQSPTLSFAGTFAFCRFILGIGLGAVPAIVALFFRLSIRETPRYLIDVEREIDWTRNIEGSQIGNYEYQRNLRSTQNTSRPNHLLDMYQHFRSGKSGKYLILAC